MISREEVINLAVLARLNLPVSEVDKLCHDLEAILGYVARLKVETTALVTVSQVRTLADNTLRVDNTPHETGVYTGCLLAMSPKQCDDYFVVKPIFSNDAT